MKSNIAKVNSSTFWEEYYSKHREPANCSLFAEFVAPFLKKGNRLLEFGCGNARDSIYFAKLGVDVMATDQCPKELDFLSDKFKDLDTLNFESGDMTNLPSMEPSDYLYSRFTIHAIDRAGESRLLNWASDNIKSKGLFFIEVRSIKDDLFGKGEALADNAFFTDHYRRFITLKAFEERLESNDFEIIYRLESNGLAPFKEDDPTVIRVIAQKK